MYNTLWLNPAYAGTRDLLTATAIHRSQWVDFNGAPMDQSFTLHAPVLAHKGGCGLSFINDQLGPTKSTWVGGDFAYQIKINSKSKLSVGVKGMVNIYRNNISALKLDQQNDVAFAQNVQSVLPNVGTGVYYYSKKFYAGISAPRLLQNHFSGSAAALAREQRHYFFITGCAINLNAKIVFKPTAFVKVTAGAPIEGDITPTFIFSEKFYLGINYRTGDALGALVGINLTEQINIGYSYDWSFANTTMTYNTGSHEIMLRYDLIYKADKKIKSPRYF
jgi:type IX secretion system PorP/SprF family membrane protein